MKKKYILYTSIVILLLSGCTKAKSDSNDKASSNNVTVINNEALTDNEVLADNEVLSDDKLLVDNEISNSDLRVLCWGTSLTYGTGGEGVTMPNVLEELSGATVYNYGGYAENTNCIATRSGASKLTITDTITIPADVESLTQINISSEFGETDELLKYTDAGLNPVTINNISGKLYGFEDEGGVFHYWFQRLAPGDETQIEKGTTIIPFSVYDRRDDDINVIWTAGNDNLQSTDDINLLIEKIDKMIAFSGSEKYIIVSEMNLHDVVPVTDEVNARFTDYYKEHFVNLRKYLIEDAFSDLGISPSEGDLQDIESYEIPRYFRDDEVHGNATYYRIAGEQIYKKCQELGYLK